MSTRTINLGNDAELIIDQGERILLNTVHRW
jgi:hypothetical protein